VLPKISVCVFVKDSIENPFCLWESTAALMPVADEYIIMDLGSTDGTLETLKDLASRNPKVRLEHGTFDLSRREKVFADLANQLIGMAKNDLVLHHQADEVFHEDLVSLFVKEMEAVSDFSPSAFPGRNFWRYQLKNNFQVMKWFPHAVNHLDLKERMRYVGDGMSTVRPWDSPFVGEFKDNRPWQELFKHNPPAIPTNQMILDVSMIGGFLDNIPDRRRKHAPIWGENPEVIYLDGHAVNLEEWHDRESQNPEWTAKTSPFNIPAIMRGLVGETRYRMRDEVLARIAEG
jgi:hypothetical protein